MPGRLRKAAIGGACVLALGLSFVVARAGGEPQADDPVVPVVPATKPAAETTTSQLGQAHGLPALAPARPKPAKRRAATPKVSAPPPAAPAPAAPAPPAEAAYTPPPVPVTPAQPRPAPPPTPPQPDPSPPVYFDDSG
jgi:hypothetical protein